MCLSSCYHHDAQGKVGHIDFDDLNFEKREYDGWVSYGQSKLANLLHARELAKRLEGTGVTAASVHPGFVRTNLMQHTMGSTMIALAGPALSMMGRIEPWPGAQTSLQAILADDLTNGGYYAQTNSPQGAHKGGWPCTSPLAEASDDAVAARLWEVSEKIISEAEAPK